MNLANKRVFTNLGKSSILLKYIYNRFKHTHTKKNVFNAMRKQFNVWSDNCI